MGYFIGHRQYVKSELQIQIESEKRELKKRLAKEKWDSQWITVWRLKRFRLWTDQAIVRWLGKPKTKGKYRVFSVDDVRIVEAEKDFKDWLAPRLTRKLLKDEFFNINKL